jgi:ribosomal protein S6--L-glutamate ligase
MNMAGLKIGFIVERRYLKQEMPGAVIRHFKALGIDTEVICPQDYRFEPEGGLLHGKDGVEIRLHCYDIIVSRNRNALGLAMLSYADAAGIPAINTHASTQRVRNKAKMAVALSRAGVPCAPTVLANDISVLAELSGDWYPLILKATYGDNSQGLRLIRRPEDLADVHWGDDLVLAQHYLPNDGFDLKLYVCGRRVFAMRKPSPFNGDPKASPRQVQLDGHMAELAFRCGETFGLEIYGVDTIETENGLAVIEVNEFPNFTGVPAAEEHIADYILAQVGDTGGVRHANRIHAAKVST